MKILVVCLLLTAALGDAAPSDVLPGDVPAIPPNALTSSTPVEKTSADSGVLPRDVSALTPNVGTSSPSLVSSPVEKTSSDSDAALLAEKVEPAAGAAPAMTPVDAEVKIESEDKGDAPVEPIVEAAEPSMFSGLDVPLNAPVKKVPIFAPVEYAGAYNPENFFKPSPVSPVLSSGYVAAPAAAYHYRSVANPWYQLVSPEVPIVTLYPEDSVESFTRAVCADHYLKYVLGGDPVTYGGPAAASPYAANSLAAASLANSAHGGNPNPYVHRVPPYRLSHIPYAAPSVDYSRSNLISATPQVSQISSISPHTPVSRISTVYPSSSVYVYPGSSKFNPQLAPMTFYTSNGMRREYAAEPDRLVNK